MKSTSFVPLLLCLVVSIGVLKRCNQTNPTADFPPGALGSLRTVSFELGGEQVEIEVAYTIAEQSQGLMYRKSMPDNHGMLFVYDEPKMMSFWMKNTLIPLSIAFIDRNGVIVNIEDMKPSPGPYDPVARYSSKKPCVYALEMNLGWFQKHGIEAGDTIQLPLDQIEQLIAEKK